MEELEDVEKSGVKVERFIQLAVEYCLKHQHKILHCDDDYDFGPLPGGSGAGIEM